MGKRHFGAAAGNAIREGLARLADPAPTELVLLAEGNDMALVAEDFRTAMATVDQDDADDCEHDEELVEA